MNFYDAFEYRKFQLVASYKARNVTLSHLRSKGFVVFQI